MIIRTKNKFTSIDLHHLILVFWVQHNFYWFIYMIGYNILKPLFVGGICWLEKLGSYVLCEHISPGELFFMLIAKLVALTFLDLNVEL